MNRIARFIVVALSILSGCVTSYRPVEDESSIRNAIARALHEHGEAVMRGNAAGAAAVFAQDVRWMPADSPDVYGRDGVTTLLAKFFSDMGPPRDVRHTTEELYIFGDAAVEVGFVTAVLEAKGGAPIRVRQRYMLLWKRQDDGSWKIFRDMVNNAGPPSPSSLK